MKLSKQTSISSSLFFFIFFLKLLLDIEDARDARDARDAGNRPQPLSRTSIPIQGTNFLIRYLFIEYRVDGYRITVPT